MIKLIVYYALRSLLCTIIIETIVAFLIGIRNKKDIILIILVNIFTNLLVNATSFGFNYFIGISYRNIVLIIMELFAFLSEAIIYKKYLEHKKINPFVLSLVLNLISYTIGVLINKGF